MYYNTNMPDGPEKVDKAAPIEARVGGAIVFVEKELEPIIAKIETEKPGHPLGRAKVEHMRKMAEDFQATADSVGFSAEQAQLLKAVLRFHDIGRLIETAEDKNTLRPGVRHGSLSTSFLREAFNKYFTPLETQTIAFAIFYHSEKLKDFERAAAGFKSPGRDTAVATCQILREMDSLERLENTQKFLLPAGIWGQIKAHYTNPDLPNPLKVDKEVDDSAYVSTITELVSHRSSGSPATRLEEIVNGDLSETAIALLHGHQEIPIQEVAHSYANYMALQVAIIFETTTPSIIEDVYFDRKKYLFPRLAFLQRALPEKQFDEVVTSLATFFQEKLDYENLGDVAEIKKALTPSQNRE